MSRVDAKTNPLTKGLTQNLFKIPFTRDKSIKFDGTDDYVDTGIQPAFIHTNATISFWCNMANFSGFQALGCFSSGKQFYVGFNGTAAGFALQATGKSSTDISAHITAGLWHHIALVADGGTATYYVDGVARDTHSYTPAASANPDTNFYIGAIPNGSGGITYPMEGSIDEVAIFSSALTAREVDALYNNGQPKNLSSYSTLAHWYRMGEGKLGTNVDGTDNILFQGIEYTGAELLTNGDFSTDTDWTDYLAGSSGGSVVITGGQLKITQGSNSVWMGASQSFSITQGKTYSVRGTYSGGNSHGRIKVGNSAGNDTYLDASSLTPGNKLVQFTATATGTAHITFLDGQGATNIGYWDNVSVKEAKGQQVGGELVTNGGFSADSDWSKTNATISSGSANLTVTGGSSASISQNISLTSGAVYVVTAVVSGTAGKQARFTDNGGLTSSNGLVTFTGENQNVEIFWSATGSSNQISFTRHNNTGDYSFTVDNVSVREVQNVGTINGARIQADGGTELVTGFTNGSVYPLDTLVTSGRDITSAIESTGNWGGAASNTLSIVSGQTYKVTFNLTYNSGSDTLRVALVDTASGAATLRSNVYYTNTNGVNVAYLTATATDTSAHLQLGTWHSTDLINFSATDISLKEVTESVPKKTQNLPSAGSAKSMDFDGTDDFVDTGFQPDFIHTNATVPLLVPACLA